MVINFPELSELVRKDLTIINYRNLSLTSSWHNVEDQINRYNKMNYSESHSAQFARIELLRIAVNNEPLTRFCGAIASYIRECVKNKPNVTPNDDLWNNSESYWNNTLLKSLEYIINNTKLFL